MTWSVIAAHTYITSVSTSLLLEQLSRTGENNSFKYSSARRASGLTFSMDQMCVYMYVCVCVRACKGGQCDCKHMNVCSAVCALVYNFLYKHLNTGHLCE